MELKPAYITIVEGPPPDFEEATHRWANGVLEGASLSQTALVQMRTFDGAKLVQRCQTAWREGRPARLNFPVGDGTRGELDIVATRWEKVDEGDKIYLWVRIDAQFDIEEIDGDDWLNLT